MYELARADAGILHASAALRPESGAEVLVAGVVDVSSSGAVYLGPADGDNGAQGLVVRVPPGRLRVLASRRANGVAAVSLELLPGEETQRAPLPAPAYWHEAPGGLPVVTSERWPLLICDAALRDQFRNPQEGFPWHQWLSDVVRSALLASGGLGVAPVSWPGRAESFVAVDGAVAPEGLVVFGGFSAEGRPVHLHGHVLVSAVDAPHSGPGMAARPEQPEAPLPPAAGPRPVQPPPMGEPEPSPLMDSLGRAGSRTSHAWVAAAARGQSLPQDHPRPEEEQAPPAPPALRPPRPSGTTIIAPNRTVDTLLDDDDEAGSPGAEQGSPEAADPRDGPAKRSRWPRLPRRRQKQAEPASGQPWTAAPPSAPGGAQGRTPAPAPFGQPPAPPEPFVGDSPYAPVPPPVSGQSPYAPPEPLVGRSPYAPPPEPPAAAAGPTVHAPAGEAAPSAPPAEVQSSSATPAPRAEAEPPRQPFPASPQSFPSGQAFAGQGLPAEQAPQAPPIPDAAPAPHAEQASGTAQESPAGPGIGAESAPPHAFFDGRSPDPVRGGAAVADQALPAGRVPQASPIPAAPPIPAATPEQEAAPAQEATPPPAATPESATSDADPAAGAEQTPPPPLPDGGSAEDPSAPRVGHAPGATPEEASAAKERPERSTSADAAEPEQRRSDAEAPDTAAPGGVANAEGSGQQTPLVDDAIDEDTTLRPLGPAQTPTTQITGEAVIPATGAPGDSAPQSTGRALQEAMRAIGEHRGRDALARLGVVLAAIERGADDELRRKLAEQQTSPAQLVDVFADLQLESGHPDDALRSVERALGEEAFTRDEVETLHLRKRAGELGLRTGAVSRAARHLDEARSHALRLLDPASPIEQSARQDANDYLAQIVLLSADAQLRAGDTARASADAFEAQGRFEQLARPRLAGRAAFLRAMAAEHADDAAGRLAALQDAERVFRDGDEPDGLGTALGFLGEADAHRGDLKAAIAKFLEARSILERAGEYERASVAMDNTAVCLDRLGDAQAADDARRTARELLSRS